MEIPSMLMVWICFLKSQGLIICIYNTWTSPRPYSNMFECIQRCDKKVNAMLAMTRELFPDLLFAIHPLLFYL